MPTYETYALNILIIWRGGGGDALTLEYKCYTIFLKKFIPIILTFTFIELSFINYIFCKKSKLKNCKTFFLKQFI